MIFDKGCDIVQHDKIDLVLKKRENRLKWWLRSTRFIVWGMFPFLMVFFFVYYPLLIAASILCQAIAANLGIALIAQQKLGEVEARKTYLIWVRLRNAGYWRRKEPLISYISGEWAVNSATQEFGGTIETTLYDDPAGEILPLRRAVQVMNTFQQQQNFLRVLDRRIDEITPLRTSLSHKIEQLRELQETSSMGEQSLRELNHDEAALHDLKDRIQASCERFDALLLTVKNAIRVRDLHQEVVSLAQQAKPGETLILTPNELEAVGAATLIEQAIVRELETGLLLEHETAPYIAKEAKKKWWAWLFRALPRVPKSDSPFNWPVEQPNII